MRWSLANTLYVIAAASVTFGVISIARTENEEMVSRPILGGYLALLSAASAVAINGTPKWKRFCCAYSIFGWAYFAFVMRFPLLIAPRSIDLQTKFIPTITYGILLGFMCAFLVMALPAPAERTNVE